MFGTDGDEVAVIDIVEGSRGVAIDGDGVGIHLVGTGGHVATGKDGVADNDTVNIELVPIRSVQILILQEVQVFGRHVLTCVVGVAVEGNGVAAEYLAGRCYDDATILGEQAGRAVVVVAVGYALRAVAGIDVTEVAASEDVAIAVGHAIHRANLAAIDVDVGLSEDVAAGVQGTYAVQVVEAAAAAEDILKNLTTIHKEV